MNRRPGTPRLLRAINDRSALELLIEHGPLSRPQLGALTGLSKPTASQLLVRLAERGLVEAVGQREGGRGPNAQLYAVVPSCGYVAAIEVGPAVVRAQLADITGAVAGEATVPVGEPAAAADPADPVALVHGAVASAATAAGCSLDRLRRVVIGTPGIVDPWSGDIRFAWDLPSWHRGLLAALRTDLSAPVVFENDVNLAAIAERHAGAAADRDDFGLIWLGRGVGLSLVIDGRVHHGAAGGAGEIGFLPVPGAEVARPGQRGTRAASVYPGGFQSLVSAKAVRELAGQHGIDAGSAEDALLAARAGDARGGALLDQLAGRLAVGVAAVCAVVDPGLVVLAGEVGMAGGDPLAERVATAVADISPLRPEVRVSTVDGDPVLRGALRSALVAAREEIFGSTTS